MMQIYALCNICSLAIGEHDIGFGSKDSAVRTDALFESSDNVDSAWIKSCVYHSCHGFLIIAVPQIPKAGEDIPKFDMRYTHTRHCAPHTANELAQCHLLERSWELR